MTGFALPRGDIDLPTTSSDTVSPCGCHRGDYCPEGETLARLYVSALGVDDQFGDRIPLNIAVFHLSIHWGLNRLSTLLALMKQPWLGRASASGKSL